LESSARYESSITRKAATATASTTIMMATASFSARGLGHDRTLSSPITHEPRTQNSTSSATAVSPSSAAADNSAAVRGYKF
jgi:hypothetical protein